MDETSDLSALKQGRLLGGRFEIHGVIGRGGTATVVLATDRLRGERVALKIVHPHLASDPAAQRRLRREVKTASVLRSDAALVPNDLHELDGMLALSMPFHPGQTLAERVATRGALSPGEVRALGIRLASALSDAHRAGVLHRDVTPNNVLLGDDPSSAVLTDFGLARLTLGQTRSTGMLGTAGYAAPEIYEGERADLRSDLYGLGAVLYLAATGSPPFDTRSPMASLKQQLEGSFEAVSSKAPAVPADLAAVIERLLAADPKARPATARDVIDALEGHPAAPQAQRGPHTAQQAAPAARISGRFLPPGHYTVVIRERGEDHDRRERLRRATDAPRGLPDEIARIGWHLADRVRDAFGVPKAPVLTPEEQLVAALAAEMQIPPDALVLSHVLKRKRFRLIDATDKETAEQLAEAAQASGFRAEVRALDLPEDPRARWWYAYFAVLAVGWSTLPFEMRLFGGHFLWLMIAISAGVPIAFEGLGIKFPQSQRQRSERLPVAYRADLVDALAKSDSVVPRFPTQASRELPPQQLPEASQAPATAEPGARAEEALDRLDALLSDPEIAGLPEPALRDLSGSSRELRSRARLLSLDVKRLQTELSASSREDDQLSVLSARLARLETLARAGEASNREERERLSKAIERHEESQRAAERVESEWIAASAQLSEIASAADRIRRELLVSREDRSVDAWVERLSREAKAATEARREADPADRARDAARAQVARERA